MKSRFLLSMLILLLIGLLTAQPAQTFTASDSALGDHFTLQQNKPTTMPKEETYTVTTPNPHFNGVREGVQFQNGEGMTDDEQVAKRLVNIWGYECEELATEESESGSQESEEKAEDKSEKSDETADEKEDEDQKSEFGSQESEESADETDSADGSEKSDKTEATEDDANLETVTEQEFGDETVEMTEKDGVAYPKPDNTNAALKAFMDAHEIDYETDDNKADLNMKIGLWVESQIDESGKADSQPENGK